MEVREEALRVRVPAESDCEDNANARIDRSSPPRPRFQEFARGEERFEMSGVCKKWSREKRIPKVGTSEANQAVITPAKIFESPSESGGMRD
jgi:hypothetical protein